MRDRERALRRVLLAAASLLLLVLGTASPASAHAALRATDPEDGTILQRAPRALTLTYTESVGLLTDSFRVYDPENHRLRTGQADHAPGRADTVRVPLPARMAKGTYVVAWRVVSADSHPVSGALTFSVGERTVTTATAPGAAENGTTTSLYNIARYLAYLAVALVLGAAAFVAYCRPPHRAALRPLFVFGTAALLVSTLALLLLRGPYEEGTAPAFTALGRTLTTRPGELLLVRLALLLSAVAGALVLRRRPVPRRAALTAGATLAVALALTWSAAEHASAGIQVPLAIASTTLHLLAMASWLGGLAALLVTLRAAAVPPQVVTRFSRLALTSVIVLVVTGVYQSWRGLGSWQALTDTTYGRVLLAKLVAVGVLLGAAAWSRRWTGRLAKTTEAAVPVPVPAGGPALLPEPPAPETGLPLRHLRRPVLAEAAVGVVVLVLTTLLTSTLPGRAAEEAATAETGIPAASVTTVPFTVGENGRGKVQITFDPGRVGPNSVQAVVYGANGALAAVPELRITMTLPAQRLGPLDTGITDRGGYWATNSFNLPIPGTWTMKVTVRVSDLDQVTVSRRVRVAR
ncbi:copper transport protein [Streptomyces sp. BK022]|uniref:copper resistance CopC/CopD family protein n=1 Tax=Streptomyces sp. BK022 TaxID=2512123 RepID=UPI0010E62010|nr:copper resistance protein CopC [Streptomyces sp. BK022]RZU29898.1 copper transport protein [Streptomyces sp. BK022]